LYQPELLAETDFVALAPDRKMPHNNAHAHRSPKLDLLSYQSYLRRVMGNDIQHPF
jgi:hypothetical protein